MSSSKLKRSRHSKNLSVLELKQFTNELRAILGLKPLPMPGVNHKQDSKEFVYQDQIINDGNRQIHRKIVPT